MELMRALLSAMRTWRTRQISRSSVDRLIAGGSPGPDEHRGLGALLEAARAPATSGELAGERAAVEGFVAARRATAPVRPRGKNRVRVPLSVRTVAMKVAAGVAVLTVSGTALAARTGNLPDSAQRRAHAIFASLGVPAPAPTPTAAPPTRTTGSSSAGTTAPATSGPGSATSTTPPGIGISPNAAAADLCRRWKADQDDPSGITLNADDHKTLRELAGSERDIPGYCATVPTPAPTTEPGTTPTDPGNPGRGRATKTPGNGNPHTK